MSVLIARDSAETLLPALSTLIKYKSYYKDVLQYLQSIALQKIQQMEDTKCSMEQFLHKSQKIVDNLTLSIDTQVRNFLQAQNQYQKYQSQPQFEHIEKPQQEEFNNLIHETPKSKSKIYLDGTNTRPKIKTKARCSTKQKDTTKKARKLTQTERAQLIERIITKMRPRNYQQEQEAKLKMDRNTKISQADLKIFLQKILASEQKQNYITRMFHKVYYHVCNMCELWVATSINKPNIPKHYAKYHQLKINPEQPAIFNAEQLYQMLKEKIDKGELVYYKCNCMIGTCPSKEEYLKHIKENHNNIIPPYSSHIFIQGQQVNQQGLQLIQNKQYNQYCILQDIVLGDVYYCGRCRISFRYCAQLYYDHMVNFHKGVDHHPGNSHIIKKQFIYFRNNVQNNSDQRGKQKSGKIRKIVNQPKIKRQRQRDQHKQHKVEKRQTKRYTYLDFPEELKDKYPQYKIFEDAIDSYKGPYICSHCQHNFENYQKIKEHFDNTSLLGQGFFQSYFIRITMIPLFASKIRFKLYVPKAYIDQQILHRVIRVPFKDGSLYTIQKYQTMRFEEFLQKVKSHPLYKKGVRYSAFVWLLE